MIYSYIQCLFKVFFNHTVTLCSRGHFARDLSHSRDNLQVFSMLIDSPVAWIRSVSMARSDVVPQEHLCPSEAQRNLSTACDPAQRFLYATKRFSRDCKRLWMESSGPL